MQHDDQLRLRVKSGLKAATQARQDADPTARLLALEDAWTAVTQVEDAALLATTCWRLAKARFDAGHTDTMLDALTPLIGTQIRERGVWGVRKQVGPFDHYEGGLRALEPLTRRHWDHHGYGPTVLDDLWDAWFEVHKERQATYMIAWGRTIRAWSAAATGKLAEVRAEVLELSALAPSTFAGDPHGHPRATHADDRAAWLQVDAARLLLRAATWARDERIAWEARELLADAAIEADLDLHTDVWALDAVLRACARFDAWTATDDDVAAYRRLLPTLPACHQARAAVWLARHDGAPYAHLAEAAAHACNEAHAGPEWVVEAWLDAQADGHPTAHQHAVHESERTGVVIAV